MFDSKFILSHVDMAFKSILAKNHEYNMYWSYYDSEHPKTFLTKRLKTLFKDIDANFIENWCSVVITTMLERIILTGFKIAQKPDETKMIGDIWSKYNLNLEAKEVHEMTLVTGEGFLIAWPESEFLFHIYANDSRNCHAFYSSDNPRQMSYAAKLWQSGGRYKLTLYYPDRLEYYISKNKASKTKGGNDFTPIVKEGLQNPAPNPYNKIPVFHFRTSRRKIKSELKAIISPQNTINKSLNDMMASQEFDSFPQRYIISNAKIGKYKSAPSELWDIPGSDGSGQDTEVGQFGTVSPEGFLKVMDRETNTIAAISRTPTHSFFLGSSNISAESVFALEAPLNHKCEDRIQMFSPVWSDTVSFIINVKNGNNDLQASDVIPIYKKSSTVQPLTQSIIRKNSVTAGLPLSTVLRDEGRNETEVNEILEERDLELARRQNTLATAVMSAQADLNAGGQDNGQLIEDSE